MVEINELNSKTELEQATPPEDTQAAQKSDRQKLPAEKTFDRAVYGGISYFAQAAAGIILAHWLTKGKGRPYYDKISEWLGPKIFTKQPVEKAVKEAGTLISVTTLVTAGNIFLIPVKWLEDRKAKIVRSMHEKHVQSHEAKGHTYSPEERAKHEECLQQLENEPKQTWGSLLTARAASLGAVYATMFAIGHKRNEAAEHWAANTITKGLDNAGFKKIAQSKTFKEYIHLGFLDVFYSAVSAGGLYVYSHYISPPKKSNGQNVAEVSAKAAAPEMPSAMAMESPEIPTMSVPPISFQERVKARENKSKPESLYTQKLASENDKTSNTVLSH